MTPYSHITMNRRWFTLAATAGTLAGLPSIRMLAAREAPATGDDLSSLGLPELVITVHADRFDGLPDGELAAGRYLLTATVAEGIEYGEASLMAPPPGMSAEEFITALATPDGPPPGDAPEGAQGDGEEGGPPGMMVPLFFYQARFAGGAGAPGGSTAQVVLDLSPGEWILGGVDDAAGQVPVTFTVAGEMPPDAPEPDAGIAIRMIDFAISVDGALTAGDHHAHVQNHGAQPHFVVILKGPDSMTNDDIATLVQAMVAVQGGGTPPELPFDPEKELLPVWQTSLQSIGTSQWKPLSLETGTYAALCFFPTAGDGLPHAAHGMHTVFTVT